MLGVAAFHLGLHYLSKYLIPVYNGFYDDLNTLNLDPRL